MIDKSLPTRSIATRRVLFLLCSARRNGNTELLAKRAAAALPAATVQEWIWLQELQVPAFEDIRHEGEGTYPAPEGVLSRLLESTLAATDIVFAAPLYWYGLPANAKLYLDHWSGWLRLPVQFKARMAGKTLWALSVYSDTDPLVVEPLFETLRRTASYMSMHWGGELLGDGNRPGDVMKDQKALAGADRFLIPART